MTVNSSLPGTFTLTVAAEVPAGGGLTLPAGASAIVTYVDAQLTLTPSAPVAEVTPRVAVTAALTLDHGSGFFGPAPDCTVIMFMATGLLTS